MHKRIRGRNKSSHHSYNYLFHMRLYIIYQIVVWFHEKRRRQPGNTSITVKSIPEHGFVYENIENFGPPFLEIQ